MADNSSTMTEEQLAEILRQSASQPTGRLPGSRAPGEVLERGGSVLGNLFNMASYGVEEAAGALGSATVDESTRRALRGAYGAAFGTPASAEPRTLGQSTTTEPGPLASFPPEPGAPEGGIYDEEAAASFPVDAAEQEASAYDQRYADAYNDILQRLMGQFKRRGAGPEAFGYRPEARQTAFDTFEKRALEIQAKRNEAVEEAKRQREEAKKRYEEAMDLQGQYKFDQNKAFPSAGSKIAAAIAIGLGEAARGFRGGQGQNIGLTLVNQSIEREIERQKLEYKKLADRSVTANNLYSRMIQLADSEQAADDLMKAKLTDIAYKEFLSQEKDIQDRNSAAVLNAQMAEARRQAEIKAQMSMMSQRRQGGLKEKDKLDLERRRGEARGTLDQILTVEKNIKDKYKGKKYINIDESDLDSASSRFFNIVDQVVRDQDLNVAGGLLATFSKDFALTREARTILNKIAFGLAAEGQSASSISDKDVERFMRVLADPLRTDEQLMEALDPFKRSLQRSDAFLSGLIDQNLSVSAASAVAEEMFPRQSVLDQQRRRRQQQSGVVKAE